ncbi:hypothetical protein CDD83_4737 [Cordyceps sp. RAO-2017]|nr:hypothetical protein CDD83_4737 [Cordyceps sp. RAO-2017]
MSVRRERPLSRPRRRFRLGKTAPCQYSLSCAILIGSVYGSMGGGVSLSSMLGDDSSGEDDVGRTADPHRLASAPGSQPRAANDITDTQTARERRTNKEEASRAGRPPSAMQPKACSRQTFSRTRGTSRPRQQPTLGARPLGASRGQRPASPGAGSLQQLKFPRPMPDPPSRPFGRAEPPLLLLLLLLRKGPVGGQEGTRAEQRPARVSPRAPAVNSTPATAAQVSYDCAEPARAPDAKLVR